MVVREQAAAPAGRVLDARVGLGLHLRPRRRLVRGAAHGRHLFPASQGCLGDPHMGNGPVGHPHHASVRHHRHHRRHALTVA